MKHWWLEFALPWLWRRGANGNVCEQMLLSIYWSDGLGISFSFTRTGDWTPFRLITDC